MKEENYKNFYLSMIIGIFAIKGLVNGFEFGIWSYEFLTDVLYGISIMILTIFYIFEKEQRHGVIRDKSEVKE